MSRHARAVAPRQPGERGAHERERAAGGGDPRREVLGELRERRAGGQREQGERRDPVRAPVEGEQRRRLEREAEQRAAVDDRDLEAIRQARALRNHRVGHRLRQDRRAPRRNPAPAPGGDPDGRRQRHVGQHDPDEQRRYVQAHFPTIPPNAAGD